MSYNWTCLGGFLQKSEEGSTNYTNIQVLRKALFKNAKHKIMRLDSHFPFRVDQTCANFYSASSSQIIWIESKTYFSLL